MGDGQHASSFGRPTAPGVWSAWVSQLWSLPDTELFAPFGPSHDHLEWLRSKSPFLWWLSAVQVYNDADLPGCL